MKPFALFESPGDRTDPFSSIPLWRTGTASPLHDAPPGNSFDEIAELMGTLELSDDEGSESRSPPMLSPRALPPPVPLGAGAGLWEPSPMTLLEVGSAAAARAPLAQLRGRMAQLSRDQQGCRVLQQLLEGGDEDLRDAMFDELYAASFPELMMDPFGNYLCQRLFDDCSDAQRLAVLLEAVPRLFELSCNVHGTRTVQKLFERLPAAARSRPLALQQALDTCVHALAPHAEALILDLNGNHVVQRVLQHFGGRWNQFVFDTVCAHCLRVASHRHGCCVLQRCVDFATPAQREALVAEITSCALPLVKDPFGNYAVQYVLDLPELCIGPKIIRQLLGHVLELSMQKFSSNVIEKCLQVTEGPARQALICEVASDEVLPVLMQDPFANYVVQTALNVADPVQYAMLIDRIRPHMALLRNTPYGKRILNRVERKAGAGEKRARRPERRGSSATADALRKSASTLPASPGAGAVAGIPGGNSRKNKKKKRQEKQWGSASPRRSSGGNASPRSDGDIVAAASSPNSGSAVRGEGKVGSQNSRRAKNSPENSKSPSKGSPSEPPGSPRQLMPGVLSGRSKSGSLRRSSNLDSARVVKIGGSVKSKNENRNRHGIEQKN